jgi:signal transduction histidine kinase
MLTQNMFKPSLGPASLNSILEEVCGMLTPESQVQGMQICLKKLKNDVTVAIDKMRTQQILINLTQNAIKYSNRKGQIFVSVS